MAPNCKSAVGEPDATTPLAQSIRLPVAGFVGYPLVLASKTLLRRISKTFAFLHSLDIAAQHDVDRAYCYNVAPALIRYYCSRSRAHSGNKSRAAAQFAEIIHFGLLRWTFLVSFSRFFSTKPICRLSKKSLNVLSTTADSS